MVKVIKTEDDYDAVLEEVESLVDLDPEEGTAEADRLELLTLLVQDYESGRYPTSLPDPIDAIRFRMEQTNLKQADLVPYIGSRSKVSEVLSGKRALSLPMIRALHANLGIPAKVLLQERDPTLLEETGVEWEQFPIREMLKRGWIRDKVTSVRDQAEDVMRRFFAQASPNTAFVARYRKAEQRHVRSGRSMDPYALLAWTARVIALAQSAGPMVEYTPGTVDLDFMKAVAHLSSLERGPALAQELMAKHGVSLVIEPHLSRTHLDGAAVMVEDLGRPVIGLTVRHNRIDNFWFSLMHELAHIALHMDAGLCQFYDDFDVEGDRQELEADRLARDALIPPEKWESSAAKSWASPSAVKQLARDLTIHPAIVAGRMRFERNSYRILNNLVGHGEVRNHFPDVEWSN